MTLKDTISELISLSGKDTVTVLEVPPGTGKTKNSIDVSVELASKGSNILFFLPTHASALTAFAYAVNAFYELYKVTTNLKKLPFIIYYEGVERYCPLYIYKSLFYKALDYAKKRWWINRNEYERYKMLKPEEMMKIFGWSIVCRKICPVYRLNTTVGNARIFVPKAFTELSKQVLTGEAKVYIKEAVNALAEMMKKGLVKQLGVYINFDKGIFKGICIRVLLSRAVVRGLKRRIQIFFKGSLIIAPTSSVEFLMKSVAKKLYTMHKSGAGVPLPILILDEYDTYFYRPTIMPIFTIRWLEFERDLANKFIEEFKNKYTNNISFDIDEATAAVTAYVILKRVRDMVTEYFDTRDSGYLSTSVSLIFDAVSEETYDCYGHVVQPFRPIILSLTNEERFTKDVVGLVKRYINKNKISFINPNDVEKNIWYYLQLWEGMLISYCRRNNIPYLVPALCTFTGTEFLTCYLERYDKHISVAKWVFLIRKKGVPHPKTGRVEYTVAYRAYQSYGTVIIPEKERETRTKLRVWTVYMMSYDCKFYSLFGQDMKIFLTSATGLPWLSEFFLSRSGLACPLDPFTSALIRYLEPYKYPETVHRPDRTDYIMLPRIPDPILKKFIIAEPGINFILKYAVHGRVSPEVMAHLPSKSVAENEPHKLYEALYPYEDRLSEMISDAIKMTKKIPPDQNYNVSLMVLCQRKDIAIRMVLRAVSLAREHYLSSKIQVCTETNCIDPPKFNSNYVSEMMKFINENKASHLLVRLRRKTLNREIKIYVTWFRSKLCRGIDLPESDTVTHTLVVGSPFRPPSTIDFVSWEERIMDKFEVYGKAGRLEKQFILKNSWTGNTSSTPLCIAGQPVDMSESINELIQAYGRALRRCWTARDKGLKYVTYLVIPYWLQNKLNYYSPIWMQEILQIDVKLAFLRAVKEGEKLRKMKEQQRQQQQNQQQQQSQEASQQQNQQQVQDTSQHQQNQQQ
ncbi:MAG: hypothetical protein QW456_08540 [Ignisphaera sp.]